MLKLLKLLVLLSGNRRYTLKELMEKFDLSDRTVYRYLEDIESAGFILNRIQGSYNLQIDTEAAKSLKKLLHFSEEEAYILYKTIGLLEGSSPIKDRLAGKLNALYDFKALSQLPGKNTHEAVNKLGKAINEGKQVRLKAYRSSNSDTIADRIVEPFDFWGDYSGVWCYDIINKSCKHFKIARIDEVEVLNENAVNGSLHKIPFTDAFRMSASEAIGTVEASLTLKAYNLLIEEYPIAEAYVKITNDQYALKIPVADFNGIGRFVLGLPGEVKAITPKEFIDFLKERRKYFSY